MDRHAGLVAEAPHPAHQQVAVDLQVSTTRMRIWRCGNAGAACVSAVMLVPARKPPAGAGGRASRLHRLGAPLHQIRHEVQVAEADGAIDLREDGQRLGVMGEVVEGVLSAIEAADQQRRQLAHQAHAGIELRFQRILETYGDDDVGALLDRNVHRQRVANAAIHQAAAVEFPGRKYQRHRGRGSDGVGEPPLGQQHLLTGDEVRRHQM